jgi:hypothetical protein
MYLVTCHGRLPAAGTFEDTLGLADIGPAGSLQEVLFRSQRRNLLCHGYFFSSHQTSMKGYHMQYPAP